MTPEQIEALFKAALAAQFGLFIRLATEHDKEHLYIKCHDWRRHHDGYDDLVVMRPHPPEVLFIIHKDADAHCP